MSKKIPTTIRLNNLPPEFDEAIRLKRIELLQQGKDYKKEDIVKEIVLDWKNKLIKDNIVYNKFDTDGVSKTPYIDVLGEQYINPIKK